MKEVLLFCWFLSLLHERRHFEYARTTAPLVSLPLLVSTPAECIATESSPLPSILSVVTQLHTSSDSTCTTSVVSLASHSVSAKTPSRYVSQGTCRKEDVRLPVVVMVMIILLALGGHHG